MLCFRLQNYNFFMKPAHHKQIFIDFSINLASFSDGYISYMEGSCGIKHKKTQFWWLLLENCEIISNFARYNAIQYTD